MVLKICVFIVFYAGLATAQDITRTIGLAGQSVIVNHLTTDGTKRYSIFSPVDTFIRASCTVRILCNYNLFIISRSGDKDFYDGWSNCASPQTFSSIGNELVVGLDNKGYTPGSFTCTFTAVAQNDLTCDCGWSVNTKIVGGSNTAVNEIVSHAGLVNPATKEIYCGAVIVSQFWSLTAAHCIDSQPDPSKSVLLVGDHDITTGTDTRWAKVHRISSFIKHPGYNSINNLNDIGLVKTVDYIKFNYAVGPACLPYTFNQLAMVGWFFTAVGWGTTSFGGPTSPVLKKADLKVISNTDCQKTYGADVDVTKICTFGDKVRDTCGMDSGGGLYYQYPSGQRYIMAVVNYGQYCASSAPSVNSRIDRYFSWIQTTTGTYFCNKK